MQGFNINHTVPLTGNSMYVPREASIRYRKNILRILHPTLARTYQNVKKVIFQTGYKGRKVFQRSAPRGALYGGGEKCIVYPGCTA